MAAQEHRIREVVERYVALVASGTAEEIAELYADDATLEDPVGSGVLTGREDILGFYRAIEALDQQAEMITTRVVGGEAAFCFRLVTDVGDATYTVAPIDVMTFDDDGRITSMRAFWGDQDMLVG
jgi:steroid delta-isomerase